MAFFAHGRIFVMYHIWNFHPNLVIPWCMNDDYWREWPNRVEDMPNYKDELKTMSKYFNMENDSDELYNDWVAMILTLYDEERIYFCSVKKRLRNVQFLDLSVHTFNPTLSSPELFNLRCFSSRIYSLLEMNFSAPTFQFKTFHFLTF